MTKELKDGFFEGLTDEYIRVSIRDSHIERGKMYPVRIDTITEDGLSGVLAEEE